MESEIEIKYKLIFYSDWHCGSGLAAGADMDALVVKDKNGLPYVPGKTLKGLIREAVIDILYLIDGERGTLNDKKEAFENTFGYMDDNNDRTRQGTVFFTNATFPEERAELVLTNHAQKYLFRTQAFTAIQKDGIVDEHSLRRLETVIPCELEGKIISVDCRIQQEIFEGMKMIKRLGVCRNRGLGRCQFIIDPE